MAALAFKYVEAIIRSIGPWSRTPRREFSGIYPSQRAWSILALVAVIVGGLLFNEIGFPLVGCDVKGNISSRGDRIYHTPGQAYYAQTRINWFGGEKWFCSESAARAAGWRRSRI